MTLQRLVGRRLHRHAVLHDVGHRDAPDLLGVGLGVAGVEARIVGHGRVDHAFGGVGRAMRVLLEPERILLHQVRHRRQPAAQPGLQVEVQVGRLDHVLQEVLGDRDVLRAFRDEGAGRAELGPHRLAGVVVRQLQRDGIVVLLLLVEHRDLGRDGAVEIHHDLLGVESVVVVGVAPAQRPRRHVAFLVGRGDVGERLDHGLLDLGIVEMTLAVRRDDVVAAVGDQEVVEGVVAVGRPVGGRLQAVNVDVALGLAQLLLHRLEEVPERVPGLGRVGQLEAGLLDHRVPDVERQHAAFDRHVGDSRAAW